MESNQTAKKDKDSYKFQIGESEELDCWVMLPLEDTPDKNVLGGFFQQICSLCPVVQECKPHIVVMRNSSAIVMGEDRDTMECTYAQSYNSEQYQGRINVNIEEGS